MMRLERLLTGWACVFGGALCQLADEPMVFASRAEAVAALERKGLELGPRGVVHVARPVEVTNA